MEARCRTGANSSLCGTFERRRPAVPWEDSSVNSRRLCLAIIAAALVSACASVDQQTASSQPKQDKTYATGSRIPVRDRSAGSSDVRSVDSQNATEMMNKRGVVIPDKGGPM